MKRQRKYPKRWHEIKETHFFTDLLRFHKQLENRVLYMLNVFSQSLICVPSASTGHRGEQECVRRGAEGPGAAHHSALRPLHACD